MYSLPLCPPDRLLEALHLIRVEVEVISARFDQINNVAQVDALNPDLRTFLYKLLDYTYVTWFCNAALSIENWNHYSSDDFAHLTNNCCEAGNKRLKTKFKSAYPTFFR